MTVGLWWRLIHRRNLADVWLADGQHMTLGWLQRIWGARQ